MKKIFFIILIITISIISFSSTIEENPKITTKFITLGYDEDDFYNYRNVVDKILEGNVPKPFFEELKKFKTFQEELIIDYYIYHQLGYSIINSINIVNHPTFFHFGDKTSKAIELGGIILVNRHFHLLSSYVPSQLSPIPNVAQIKRPEETIQLQKSAYSAYQLLYQAMVAQGFDIIVFSGFRTYQKQASLWDANPTNLFYLAKPGHSEHQTGLAIDIATLSSGLTDHFDNTSEFYFLARHAHEFGFIMRYPKGKESITGYAYEPWHYRFVGIIHATRMYEQNLCLEEYLYETYPIPLDLG